jgi:hypothetical protein
VEFSLREPTYRITWHVSPQQDAEILANVIAGFAMLSAAGEVAFDVVPGEQELQSRHTMLLSMQRTSDGSSRVAAIDVLDRADTFDELALAGSAAYFKCNFQSQYLAHLPSRLTAKLRPLGLAQLCVVSGSAQIIARAAISAIRAGMRSRGFASLHSGVRAATRNLTLLYRSVELSSMRPVEQGIPPAKVIYQPRGWSETSPEKIKANRWREDVVRQLRAEFGDSERIGFIKVNVGRSISPELYIARKIVRRDYIEMLKSTAVGVNSHGLSDSSTFKLSEYLAAGMAVVSDHMKFELPEPLIEGVNFLGYESPKECVDRCRELISSPGRLLAMRTANQEYFSRNLEPANQVRYLLRETFGDLQAGK